MEKTSHDFWKILLVFHGSGLLQEDVRNHPIHTGDVILVPPGTVHAVKDAGAVPLSLYGICIQSDFLKRLPTSIGLPGNLRLYTRPLWSAEMAGLLRFLLIEQSRPTPGSPAWITGLTWQIIGLLWRGDGRKSTAPVTESTPGGLARQRVAAYAQELPRNFHKEFSIDEVAGRLGLSRRRFTQLFRDATGESWLQMIRRLRINHARWLLRNTSRSITAVAFESGFSDLSHFYRVFGKTSGLSPEAWRKKALTKLK